MARRTVAFWILFAITAALYIVMIAWSLPEVSKAAGGLAPFDIRPHGYSLEEAKAFVAALSPDGKAFYLDVQERLDLFYPALLSATLFFAIYLLVPAGWGAWRWVLALAAIPSAVFDYLENHAVAAMLGLGADALTPRYRRDGRPLDRAQGRIQRARHGDRPDSPVNLGVDQTGGTTRFARLTGRRITPS